MNRRLRTILLLIAPTVLYAAGRAYFPEYLPAALVFVCIFTGIISYGYLVMPDEEFADRRSKSRILMPFAVACAGVTAIGKVVFDSTISRSLSVASIAAAIIWAAVVGYVAWRTALFKTSR
jgi:hypothetical protein